MVKDIYVIQLTVLNLSLRRICLVWHILKLCNVYVCLSRLLTFCVKHPRTTQLDVVLYKITHYYYHMYVYNKM